MHLVENICTWNQKYLSTFSFSKSKQNQPLTVVGISCAEAASLLWTPEASCVLSLSFPSHALKDLGTGQVHPGSENPLSRVAPCLPEAALPQAWAGWLALTFSLLTSSRAASTGGKGVFNQQQPCSACVPEQGRSQSLFRCVTGHLYLSCRQRSGKAKRPWSQRDKSQHGRKNNIFQANQWP